MLKETFHHIAITYQDHTNLAENANKVEEIKKVILPMLDNIDSHISSGAFKEPAYVMSRINESDHLIIYVNPALSKHANLIFYDGKNKKYFDEIPYETFIKLENPSIAYTFENKCSRLLQHDYQYCKNNQLGQKLETLASKATPDVELD